MSNTKISIQPRNRQLPGTYGRRFRRSLHGFTLIELLVVISIIALLISILLPALSKAKETARGVICMSNERSIGLSILMYAEDYDEWLPSPQGRPPIDLIVLGYLQAPIFVCPSDSVEDTVPFYPDAGEGGISYMFSNTVFQTIPGLDPNSLPSNLNMFHRPSNDFFIIDSDWPTNANESAGYPYYIFVAMFAGLAGFPEYTTHRHLGGNNCLFADGHVERVSSDMYVDKFWFQDIGDFHPINGYDFTR